MRKIIALLACLWALCAGATNITNYPVRTTFNAAYWFLLSDVTAQTNWNLPGNYVASTTDLNSVSNVIYQLLTNSIATNNTFTTITVTNGITNLNLLANSVVKTDANKALTNIVNGLGILTNDALGTFGWLPLADLTNFSSITVSNSLVVQSNAYFFATNFFNTITVTNPITNLSLMANTIVKSDANKALASVANGTGALTNNNAGLFGWFNGFASLQDITNALTIVTNNFMTNGAISIPLTNYCGVPDMSKEYGWTNITSGFTLPLPINLPSDGKHAPTFVWHIQGNGTPAQITEGVNEHVVPGSVMWVTNLTTFTFHIYGNQFTSLYAVPIY